MRYVASWPLDVFGLTCREGGPHMGSIRMFGRWFLVSAWRMRLGHWQMVRF